MCDYDLFAIIQGGWLYEMGGVDIAGCGAVHLVGGVAAVVACVYLGPRFVTPFPRNLATDLNFSFHPFSSAVTCVSILILKFLTSWNLVVLETIRLSTYYVSFPGEV